jgi:2-dehydro-3-deoxy-D-arabinonate dehydratase
LEIFREEQLAFSGEVPLTQLKRKPQELAAWLFRGNVFPIGCLMMTGTGIVPDDFTLAEGDRVKISIDAIGMLENVVGVI